jgi:hypothetical protein
MSTTRRRVIVRSAGAALGLIVLVLLGGWIDNRRFLAAERIGTYRAFHDYVQSSWWMSPLNRSFIQAAEFRMRTFRERTAELQKELASQGFYAGPASGEFGIETVQAIKKADFDLEFSTPDDVHEIVPPCVMHYLQSKPGRISYPTYCMTTVSGLSLPMSKN